MLAVVDSPRTFFRLGRSGVLSEGDTAFVFPLITQWVNEGGVAIIVQEALRRSGQKVVMFASEGSDTIFFYEQYMREQGLNVVAGQVLPRQYPWQLIPYQSVFYRGGPALLANLAQITTTFREEDWWPFPGDSPEEKA